MYRPTLTPEAFRELVGALHAVCDDVERHYATTYPTRPCQKADRVNKLVWQLAERLTVEYGTNYQGAPVRLGKYGTRSSKRPFALAQHVQHAHALALVRNALHNLHEDCWHTAPACCTAVLAAGNAIAELRCALDYGVPAHVYY